MKLTKNGVTIVFDIEQVYKKRIKLAMFLGVWWLVLLLSLIGSIVKIVAVQDHWSVLFGALYIVLLFECACDIDNILSSD